MQLMIIRCMMRAAPTLLAVLASVTHASAFCSPSCAPDKFWQGSGTEYHFNSNVPAEWRFAFDTAANDWNAAHADYGLDDMYLNPGGGMEIVVEYPITPGAIAEWSPGDNKIRISPDYSQYDCLGEEIGCPARNGDIRLGSMTTTPPALRP